MASKDHGCGWPLKIKVRGSIWSTKTEWKQAKGTGVVYSFSISRASGPIPYAIAYVTLDEGVSMMTNIVETDLDSIKIGQKVTVTFSPTDDPKIAIPMFKPA